MTFIQTILNEAVQGNFSFFILIVGLVQVWLMYRTQERKGAMKEQQDGQPLRERIVELGRRLDEALEAIAEKFEEMDAEIARADRHQARAKEMCDKNNNLIEICNRHIKSLFYAEHDRDNWKARAEALERAISGECASCLHNGESTDDANSPCFAYMTTMCDCEHWQFDQARFAPKGEQSNV